MAPLAKITPAALLALTLTATGALAQEVEITRAEDLPGQMGDPETFTGTVHVAFAFPPVMGDVSAGQVTFMPGARSAWHSHPEGQILVVTSGVGWTQERGQERQVIRAGDILWAPPGVEHWHGASASTPMTHYALQANSTGANVAWGDLVTDAEYGE